MNNLDKILINIYDYVERYHSSQNQFPFQNDDSILQNIPDEEHDGWTYQFKYKRIESAFNDDYRIFITYGGKSLFIRDEKISSIELYSRHSNFECLLSLILLYDDDENVKYYIIHNKNNGMIYNIDVKPDMKFELFAGNIIVYDNNIIENIYSESDHLYKRIPSDNIKDFIRCRNRHPFTIIYRYDLSDKESILITVIKNDIFSNIIKEVPSVQLVSMLIADRMATEKISAIDAYELVKIHNLYYRNKGKRTPLIESQIKITKTISKALNKVINSINRQDRVKQHHSYNNAIVDVSTKSIRESYHEYLMDKFNNE